MSEEGRRIYLEPLVEHGTFLLDDEKIELLDLHCPQGDTLNVHATQTPKVLVPPGCTVALESSRQLTYGDLVVDLGAADGKATLRDRIGQRYLPVHLGVAHEDFMPTLFKFLLVFGPSELSAPFPPQRFEKLDDVTVGGRTQLGNLLIHRRTWSFRAVALLDELTQPSEAAALVAANRWRSQRGIPERIFAIEKVPHRLRGTRYRPQYVDFSSPLFLDVLRAILRTDDRDVSFVEALPTPDMFPEDGNGHRRAVEILLDGLSFGPPGVSTPTRSRGASPAERPEVVFGPPRSENKVGEPVLINGMRTEQWPSA
jgi:hypothetical protein